MDLQPSPTQSVNLTNWANPPTLEILKTDLEMAKPAHDTMVLNIDRWNDLMQVKGKARPPKVQGRSSVQPKLIRRQAEWRYSALTEPFLGTQKLFKIEPATFEDTKAATQNQYLLNYQFRTKLDRVKFIDDYIRCTVDEGTCILQAGWDRVTIKVDENVPVYDHFAIESAEDAELFQQALQTRSEDPRGFNESAPPELKAAVEYYDESGTATVARQKGTEKIKVEKVIENRPTVKVHNPKNVYIDPTCDGDIDKALFVLVTFETSQAELKKQPNRYKNLDKVNWSTATPVTNNDHASTNSDYNNNYGDNLRKKVVAYEYWGFYDIDNNGTLKPIVVTWIGDTIVRMEDNPFPDEKLPFIIVPYMPVKRDMYGEPDAELLEDNQKILGAVSRGMIDLLGRSANGQQGFAKGMLDPLNRRRFERGQDYEFNPNLSPANGLIEHKYPEIPNSAIEMLSLQNNEAEALTGVKSFSGGMSGQAYGDVAAGIRGVLDAASKREMAILRRLAKGLVKLGMKFCAMNAVFLSKEEVIRITNEEFITIRREDLKGNFDLEVDISTAEVDDQKAKDLGFMLQTLGPDMEPAMRQMILAEIAMLKRMPALAKRLERWKPEPDPLAEKAKELSIRKLELEIIKLESEANLNNAKTEKTTAEADNENLDFVETETGTKHEREKEKIQAQARGNQSLEVTKALTKTRKPDEKAPDIEAAVGFNELSEGLNKSSPAAVLEAGAEPVDNTLQRDELVEEGDPRFNIGSRFFDPSADPSLNPNINL